MAYSATLANMRGLLNDSEHRRLLNLFSRAGLSMDHELFNEEILYKGTQAIMKTRDQLLRAAVPSPLGDCVFLNDVSHEEMVDALHRHKDIMKGFPRQGAGIEAFVDASDTGYTVNSANKDSDVDGQAHDRKVHMNGIDGKKDGVRNGVIDELRKTLPPATRAAYALHEDGQVPA